MATLDFEPSYSAEEIYSVAGKSLKFNSRSDIEPFVSELDRLTNVKKIDFSGNTIGVEASEALAESIAKHQKTLEEVNLSDVYTGRLIDEIPQSLEYLLPALVKCPNLHIVNLSDNAFGLRTIEQIEKFISESVYLQHLILSNNGMGPFAGARIGKALYHLSNLKTKANQPSLKTFICGRNRLENGSSAFLSLGLKAHKDLRVVKLYQNGIRPQGIANLIEGLKENKALTVLDLQDNTITTKSAKILAENLQSWEALKELNVNDCLMNPQGSLFVIKSFNDSVWNQLETLKLQYNELSEDSLEILLEVVKNKLPNLKSLELNGNRFEEDHEIIEEIVSFFEERGFGELDELDDLEEVDSDEESEEEEEEEEEEEKANFHALQKELEAEAEKYTLDNDNKEVDELASELEKASI